MYATLLRTTLGVLVTIISLALLPKSIYLSFHFRDARVTPLSPHVLFDKLDSRPRILPDNGLFLSLDPLESILNLPS